MLAERMLRRLDGGSVWRRLADQFFPELRASRVVLIVSDKSESKPAVDSEPVVTPATEPVVEPEPVVTPAPVAEPEPVAEPVPVVESEPAEKPAPAPAIERKSKKEPYYMSLHTNMLYDVFAIPNIGAEFYLGKNFSFAGNYWYSWWNNDTKHYYWRVYGGYVAPRYWLGKAAHNKPLTGHHIGVYGEILLYDFELGGTGYLSGTPGKNICHHPSWSVGLEYGFSLPVHRRLNIDFTVGFGYLQGKYWKYIPADDYYIGLAQYNRRWWGPTKAEISLVWLIGRGNVNEPRKGGKR